MKNINVTSKDALDTGILDDVTAKRLTDFDTDGNGFDTDEIERIAQAESSIVTEFNASKTAIDLALDAARTALAGEPLILENPALPYGGPLPAVPHDFFKNLVRFGGAPVALWAFSMPAKASNAGDYIIITPKAVLSGLTPHNAKDVHATMNITDSSGMVFEETRRADAMSQDGAQLQMPVYLPIKQLTGAFTVSVTMHYRGHELTNTKSKYAPVDLSGHILNFGEEAESWALVEKSETHRGRQK